MSLWNVLEPEYRKFSGMSRPSPEARKIIQALAKYQYSTVDLECIGMELASLGGNELTTAWNHVTVGINKGLSIQNAAMSGRSQSRGV